jgi:hypothetical protein
MTSDEIKNTMAIDLSTNAWLREVALQLALLNEKPVEAKRQPQKQVR